MKQPQIFIAIFFMLVGSSAQAQIMEMLHAKDFWSRDYFDEPGIYCPKGAICEPPFADDIPLTLRRMPQGMGILISPGDDCGKADCLVMKGKLGVGMASRNYAIPLDPDVGPAVEPAGQEVEDDCRFVSDCDEFKGNNYFALFGDPDAPDETKCQGDLCIPAHMRGGLDILLRPEDEDEDAKIVPWEGVSGDVDCAYKDCLVARMFLELEMPDPEEILNLDYSSLEPNDGCAQAEDCQKGLNLLRKAYDQAADQAAEFEKFKNECADGEPCWSFDFSILLGASEAAQELFLEGLDQDPTQEGTTTDANGAAPGQPDVRLMADGGDGGNSVDFDTVDKVDPADIPNPNSPSGSSGGGSIDVGGGTSVGVSTTNDTTPTRENPSGGYGGMVTVTVGTK